MIRSAVALLIAAALPCIAADTVQRQDVSSGGDGKVSGSGQVLELSVGQSVDSNFSGSGLIYGGHLNTNHAPGTVVDLLAVTGSTEASVQATWTEVGADGAIGQASFLIIKVSTNPITSQALFEAASTYAVLTPLAAGGFESKIAGPLLPGPDYYFAMEARDAAKNQGRLSNLVGNSTRTFSTPPADIASLAAAAGAAGGTANLTWLSPGDDGAVGNLNPGQFRIAGSTDAIPVFSVSNYQVLIPTIAAPGSAQSTALTGLLGNAVYTFSVFTGDDLPVFSGASNAAAALTRAYAPSSLAFSSVSSTTFTAEWGSSSNTAGTEFFVQVASDAAYTIHIATRDWTPTLTSATFAGLTTETTFYARVKARNSSAIETAYTDLGPVFLPIGIKAPLGIALTPSDGGMHLAWNPILSGDPTGTHIYRSTSAAGPFASIASLPLAQQSYDDSGLVNGDTYFYRLTSFKPGAESPTSAVYSAMPRDAVAPQGVAGVMGALQSAAFAVSWQPNLFDAAGNPLNDLRYYKVYRSTSIDGTPVAIGLLPPGGPFTFSDPSGAALAPQFYFVRAEDTSGNQSIESLWLRSPSATAPLEVFSVSPDRAAVSEIPAAGVQNLQNDEVVLQWTRHAEEENGRVVVSYNVVPLRSNGAKADPTYALPLRTRFTFRYSAGGGFGPLVASAVFKPKDLSVFVHNGVELVKIGGDVDTLNRTITVESRVTGKYLVKQSLRAEAFTVLQTVPKKIFTPNGDGVNDTFQIFFENPSSSVISQAKVYDLTGAEVSDLQLGPTGDSLGWNGKDRYGRIARGGVYLYQIQSEGKTFNGTIVLAK